jgi:hypothetical protein
MNKNEKEFNEWLVNLFITKGVFLTEGEQKELTSKLEKLGPPYVKDEVVITKSGKLSTRKKKGE